MAGFNKVILLGNLTRDPQLKYLPSNTPVCEFGLAVNRMWRDREGNQKEEVCLVDLSAFGRTAETINQYMSKGRPLLVEGRLKYDTWTSQDGTKRSKHSVVVDHFQFVGSRPDGGASRPAPEAAQSYQQSTPTQQSPPPEAPPSAGPPPSGDDIPF